MRNITIALLLSIASMSNAYAQPVPTGPSEYTLKVAPSDLDVIGRGVDELPAKLANPLTARMLQQISAQQEAFRKANQPPAPAEPEKPAPTEPPKQ